MGIFLLFNLQRYNLESEGLHFFFILPQKNMGLTSGFPVITESSSAHWDEMDCRYCDTLKYNTLKLEIKAYTMNFSAEELDEFQ